MNYKEVHSEYSLFISLSKNDDILWKHVFTRFVITLFRDIWYHPGVSLGLGKMFCARGDSETPGRGVFQVFFGRFWASFGASLYVL